MTTTMMSVYRNGSVIASMLFGAVSMEPVLDRVRELITDVLREDLARGPENSIFISHVGTNATVDPLPAMGQCILYNM